MKAVYTKIREVKSQNVDGTTYLLSFKEYLLLFLEVICNMTVGVD